MCIAASLLRSIDQQEQHVTSRPMVTPSTSASQTLDHEQLQ